MKRVILSATVGLTTFFLSPATQAASIFSETFDYPDGPLTTVSDGTWFKNDASLGVEQASVEDGRARLSFSNAEDVARMLDQPYSSGTLYYSALITMTVIPGTGGQYFMHFSDSDTGGSTDFFARTFVKQIDSEQFMLGIRNRSNSEDYEPVYNEDVTLTLDTQFAIVVKFDFTTMQSTLWINPTDESSPFVIDETAVAFVGPDESLDRLSLRQASGIGTLFLDEVRVGTTFEDVLVAVPEPHTVGLVTLGLAFTLMMAGRVRRSVL